MHEGKGVTAKGDEEADTENGGRDMGMGSIIGGRDRRNGSTTLEGTGQSDWETLPGDPGSVWTTSTA